MTFKKIAVVSLASGIVLLFFVIACSTVFQDKACLMMLSSACPPKKKPRLADRPAVVFGFLRSHGRIE